MAWAGMLNQQSTWARLQIATRTSMGAPRSASNQLSVSWVRVSHSVTDAESRVSPQRMLRICPSFSR